MKKSKKDNSERGFYNFFKQEERPSKRSAIVWNMKKTGADRVVYRGVKRGVKHRINIEIKKQLNEL